MINRRHALQGGGLLAASLLLAACGGSVGGGVAPHALKLGGTDINPQPRDKVRDGGNLRLPMSLFPSNFNINQVDGSNTDMLLITYAVLPNLFKGTADGGVVLNTDYLSSASVTSTSPQVITYTIAPKAVWSDGSPITYRDFVAYWRALNGTNPKYQVSGTAGYEDIVSVAMGGDEKQVVVTFGKPFGEWQTLFSSLTPASLNSTPDAFNTGWRATFPITSGPFTVRSIDPGSQTVTLARDPRWWGTPPKLDQVILRRYDTAALPDALANDELDVYGIGAILDLLRRAQQTAGVVVRGAPGRFAFNVTFNGAAGSPLADLPVRRAIAQAIDRQQIVLRTLGQAVPSAQPDGSHLYAPGSKQYRDNAGALPYDPAQAQRTLDSLGWTRQGTGPNAVRAKGGKKLSLRLVFGQDATNHDLAVTIQNQLAQIGVAVVITEVGANQFFPDYMTPGNFDVALLGWVSNPFPVSGSASVYQLPTGTNFRQNYGRIGSARIDALLDQALAEIDDGKRAELGNQIDALVWQAAHSVILFAVPGLVATRSTLANYGARGFADPDFINAGFVK
ncbi:MAG TPA: ABC transporter family substrate-binding protein [Pseudonocardia sp.]